MTQYGYLLCNGCDECRTDTIPADEEAGDWPCCEHFPDNKAPCCYVVVARCRSEITHDLSFSDGCSSGPTTALLMYPVFELRKKCYVGCEWVLDDCNQVEDQTADALNPAFPPAHLTGASLGFHPGDYRSGYFGCIASGLEDRWTLTVTGTGADQVTMTLTHPGLVAWATSVGKTIPVYSNIEWTDDLGVVHDEWLPFGRNRMDIIAGYDDFPMLPKSICVVAIDQPDAGDNPCSSQESRCACNDFGIGDTAFFSVTITGCDTISGTQTVTAVRTCPPTSLPCGISYPASTDCCVFIGDLSSGSGCSSGGVSWSGALKLMVYCDPLADESSRYKAKLYCYNNDTACWVEQGITVTLVELPCQGSFYIEFSVTDLDCCCPDEPPIETCLCDDALPATLTADVQGGEGGASLCSFAISHTSTSGECPGTAPEINVWTGTGTCGGTTYEFTLQLTDDCAGDCSIGAQLSINGSPVSYLGSGGDCSPFEFTFAFDGFNVVVSL